MDNLFEDDDGKHQGLPGFGSETFLWARNAGSLSLLVFCESKAGMEVGRRIGRDGQGSGRQQPSLKLYSHEGFMVWGDDRVMDRNHHLDDRFLILQDTVRPRTPHVLPAITVNPLYPKDKGVE
jgi:hypothetical protein